MNMSKSLTDKISGMWYVSSEIDEDTLVMESQRRDTQLRFEECC